MNYLSIEARINHRSIVVQLNVIKKIPLFASLCNKSSLEAGGMMPDARRKSKS